MEQLTVVRHPIERQKVEREKYEGLLSKFGLRSKGLDESLTLFFSQLFSKDAFVTSNFFNLVQKMKTLDGCHVSSVVRHMDNHDLVKMVQHLCVSDTNPHAEYVFNGSEISYNTQIMSRIFYDPDRKVSLSDLREMSDFKYLSFLNAFDLPYLTDTRIDRSSFEHFMSSFLNHLVPDDNSESLEILRFKLIQNASAHMGYTISSWVKILYLIMRIMQKMYGLAMEAVQEKFPENYYLIEKIQFFERFILARKRFLETKEMPETIESFRDFLRIDFTRITEGNSTETAHMNALQLLEFEVGQLDNMVLSSKAISKTAMDFFRQYQLNNNLSDDCKKFCDMGVRFQASFEQLLEAVVVGKENTYQMALRTGIQLLKVLYSEAFPNVPLDPKSSSNTPTPRSHRTPRDDNSPRLLARNSPRDTLRSSAGMQEKDPARAAQIKMWERRKSVGNGTPPAAGVEGRSPGLARSSGVGDVK